MTAQEIYEEATRRMAERYQSMSSADPEYQEELRRIVAAITRELAIDRQYTSPAHPGEGTKTC